MAKVEKSTIIEADIDWEGQAMVSMGGIIAVVEMQREQVAAAVKEQREQVAAAVEQKESTALSARVGQLLDVSIPRSAVVGRVLRVAGYQFVLIEDEVRQCGRCSLSGQLGVSAAVSTKEDLVRTVRQQFRCVYKDRCPLRRGSVRYWWRAQVPPRGEAVCAFALCAKEAMQRYIVCSDWLDKWNEALIIWGMCGWVIMGFLIIVAKAIWSALSVELAVCLVLAGWLGPGAADLLTYRQPRFSA